MTLRDVAQEGMRLVSGVAAATLMAGYVALGAVVLVGRGLLSVSAFGSLAVPVVPRVLGRPQIASSTSAKGRPQLRLVYSHWL